MALQSCCFSQYPKCQDSHPLANLVSPDPGPGFRSVLDQLCANYNHLQIQLCPTPVKSPLQERHLRGVGEAVQDLKSVFVFGAMKAGCMGINFPEDGTVKPFRISRPCVFEAVKTGCTYGRPWTYLDKSTPFSLKIQMER